MRILAATIRTATLAALLPLAAPAQDGPACAIDATDAARTICADPGLAALAAEQARVFQAVAATLEGDALAASRADEAAAAGARDACATDAACLRDALAERIHDLMLIVPAADDGADPTRGPYLWACPGFDEPLSAVFVNVEPALVSLRWADGIVVLPQAVSASGARYADDAATPVAEFWTKGDTATFTPPGGETVECTLAPPG